MVGVNVVVDGRDDVSIAAIGDDVVVVHVDVVDVDDVVDELLINC